MTADIFPSTYAALLFAAVIILWALTELIGGTIIPWLRRRGTKVQRRNRGSNTLVILGWVAMFGFSASFAGSEIALLPSWVYYVGIALMLLGIAVRQWAIAVLGRYFSGVIGVQKEQKVVETGPYRLVRHPSYTGALLILVGIGLAVQSWGAALVAVIIFGLVYGYRMLAEEKVLTSELGNSYVEYMERTKRILPFLL